MDVRRLERWISGGSDDLTTLRTRPMGTWICILTYLFLVQIARAENIGLLALNDGLQIPAELSY